MQKELIALLAIHYLADFIFQSHEMACKKKYSIEWLSKHVWRYSVIMFILSSLFVFQNSLWALAFTVVGGLIHWCVDYISSRWSSRYLNREDKEDDWHMFFVVVGLDQLIHTGVFIWCYFAVVSCM